MNIKQRFNELREKLKDTVAGQRALDSIEKHYYSSLKKNEEMYNNMLDELEMESLNPNLEGILKQCLIAGVSWFELQERVKTTYFTLALKNYNTQAKAAKQIGIGRTTITEHFKRVKKNEKQKPLL